MSKQRKIQKIIFCILAVILVIIFYEAIGIYTAYKKQPKVSSETKTAVQEEIKNWNQISENPERTMIIEENREALLQRIRLIQNAREEIILSTFAGNLQYIHYILYKKTYKKVDYNESVRIQTKAIHGFKKLL